MQTKDLKPGTDYAYNNHAWGDPVRVRVVEAKHSYYGYSGARRHASPSTGVLVKVISASGMVSDLSKRDGFNDRPYSDRGETAVVEARHIRKTWADHLAEKRAEKQAVLDAAESKRNLALKRATLAKRVHDALVAKGTPVKVHWVSDDEHTAALAEVGFEKVETEYYRSLDHFKSALSLYDVMGKGLYGEDVLAALLTDATYDDNEGDDLDVED